MQIIKMHLLLATFAQIERHLDFIENNPRLHLVHPKGSSTKAECHLDHVENNTAKACNFSEFSGKEHEKYLIDNARTDAPTSKEISWMMMHRKMALMPSSSPQSGQTTNNQNIHSLPSLAITAQVKAPSAAS